MVPAREERIYIGCLPFAWASRSVHGEGKWYAKFRTGKFWSSRNLVYHLCKSVPFTGKWPRRPDWYQRWLGKIEREFRLGIFRPEKQDCLFRCSVAPGHFPLEQPKKVMFHLLPNRIFRKLFVNGKQPLQISALVPTQAEGSAVNSRCTLHAFLFYLA